MWFKLRTQTIHENMMAWSCFSTATRSEDLCDVVQGGGARPGHQLGLQQEDPHAPAPQHQGDGGLWVVREDAESRVSAPCMWIMCFRFWMCSWVSGDASSRPRLLISLPVGASREDRRHRPVGGLCGWDRPGVRALGRQGAPADRRRQRDALCGPRAGETLECTQTRTTN